MLLYIYVCILYIYIYTYTLKVTVAQSCLTLCNPTDYTVHGILQQNAGVGSLSLLQKIFPIQGSNPCLLHCRWILCHRATWEALRCSFIGKKSRVNAAAAAAESLQSCLTLCDPIDSLPPGSAVPGILQARTQEWVAISFSNA